MKNIFIRLMVFFLLAQSAFADDTPAKELFGAVKLPATLRPQSAGFYSKGCLAGAVALPKDGEAWQVMRLSRNRYWGHPDLIKIVQQLAMDGKKSGWNGLLVGDLSQPRGGPMPSGHASHQIGLDADIWFTPMPDKRLTKTEREKLAFKSVVKGESLVVDPKIWTPQHETILKIAANYPQVERIFVHPAIKKKLCESVTKERKWLAKVRPYWGHDAHFHIRLKCQKGSPECKKQADSGDNDGCGAALAWWFTDEPWKKSTTPPKVKKPMTLKDLPPICTAILNTP